MYRGALLFVVFATTIGVGLYGVLRPGPAAGEAPEVVAERLRSVPGKIGPWESVDKGLTANALRVTEAEAHLSREYTHEETGHTVFVLVLYGEPGALGAHTPEVCYAGTGYGPCGAATRRTLPEQEVGGSAEFWVGRFEKNSGRDAVEVWWGWGVGGAWHAADNPRFTFADHRRIYKLYAQQSARGDSLSPAAPDSTMTVFLTAFLRELNAAVAGPER